MKIAIVDDNVKERIFLKDELKKILCKEENNNIEINEFKCGEEFVEDFKEPGLFDIIFLDIYMEEMTGVDTAREIRKIDNKVKIIFITTSNEFASESYEVKAEDYIIKPFNKERVKKTLEHSLIKKKKEERVLSFPGNKVVHVDTIVYTTFSGHYVTIFLKNESSVQIRCTQKNFEKQIEHFNEFVTSSKGITVNLNQVDNIESDRFKMKDGTYVPISRRKYPEIRKIYTRFLIDKINGEN